MSRRDDDAVPFDGGDAPPTPDQMAEFVRLATFDEPGRAGNEEFDRMAAFGMHKLRDDETWSTLDVAAADGDMAAFKRLLAPGADPFMPDEEGISLLAVASGYGQNLLLTAILRLGAPVDGRDNDGKTPLMLAMLRGEEACVLTLLEAGADFDARDRFGKSVRDFSEDSPNCLLLIDQARADREARSLAAELPAPRAASARKPSL